MDIFANIATTSAAPTSTPTTFSLDALIQITNEIKALGPEPIGEYMRSLGKDPKYHMLVLPKSMEKLADYPAFMPSYVVFSGLVTASVIMRVQQGAIW